MQSRDIIVVINNKQYTLRPTFQAISSIEAECSTGFADLAMRCETGNIKLTELRSIIMQTSKASGEKVQAKDVEIDIMETGPTTTAILLLPLFLAVLVPQYKSDTEVPVEKKD